ncbi:MAG: flagellar hook-length control protein FliK [Agathobacter sp.]|nr:flagellar hook-length control protein FliK [Agathobacter sp.]
MDITQIKLPDMTASGTELKAESTAGTQRTQATTSFADCLQSQESSTKNLQTVETSDSDSTQTDSYDRYRYKNKNVDMAKDTDTSDKASAAKDKADQLAKDVIKSVSNNLGVDEEKVTEAMEMLGLTALDLLNPQNLVQLSKELTGAVDDAGLLLNADFKQLLSDVAALGNSFAEETGVSVEMIAQITEESPELMVTAETDSGVLQAETVANDVTTDTNAALSALDVDKNADTATADATATDAATTDAAVVDAELENPKEMADNPDQSSDESADSGLQPGVTVEPVMRRQNDSAASGMKNGQFANQLANAVNEAMPEIDAAGEIPQTETYTSVDAVDVINQIVERVRISQGTDTTTIEMQLNPENLGKIYLNISSREGAVHAQLYAQNEDVKIALEAQIATLTENLNQAGVKVEAVEIAVATHEFERNLEQNAGSGEEQQEEAQEKNQTSRRSLRMDGFDDPDLTLSDEEALIAQMMKDNGNSVDFTA